METSRQSTLKVWIKKNLGANKLGIECPHCNGKAVVNRKKWLKDIRIDAGRGDGSTLIIARACTYCFKANKVQDE